MHIYINIGTNEKDINTEKKKKKPKKGEPAEDAEPETQVSGADGITEGEAEGDKNKN